MKKVEKVTKSIREINVDQEIQLNQKGNTFKEEIKERNTKLKNTLHFNNCNNPELKLKLLKHLAAASIHLKVAFS